MEKKVQIPATLISNIFGNFDENMQALEKKCGVTVVNRDDEVTVYGEEESTLHASEVIRKYGLNSSANVKRVKDALMKKEILTFEEEDKPEFLDPLFEYWIKKYYFEIPE